MIIGTGGEASEEQEFRVFVIVQKVECANKEAAKICELCSRRRRARKKEGTIAAKVKLIDFLPYYLGLRAANGFAH